MVFISFFSSSGTHQSYILVGCHAIGINSLLIYFLHVLPCLNLLHQAISLTWMIVSESSYLKLASSRLVLLRSTLRIPISSLENVILPESSLKKTITLLENTVSSSFLFV